MYELILENITVKEAPSQQLLFPVELSYSIADIELIKDLKEDLENTGFVIDRITEDTIVIKGIPMSISESQIAIIIEQLLDDINAEVPEASFGQLDIISKSLAKSLAIKTGKVLTEKEQEQMVDDLFSCKEPSTSPFGKQTFETLSLGEIDKLFTAKN
jgi:DNA mismatch repair protein MutL